MNPIFFNCLLLFLLVIFLALLQSRFKLFTDNPWAFLFLVFIMPFLVLGKVSKGRTSISWVDLTAIEILMFTLMIAYIAAKRIVPKVNEGYIYAYSLFHWYLLIDTIHLKGFNFWTILAMGISIYPTYLILRSSVEHKILERRNKIILYYWFLFTIAFTYIDQVALDIIEPVFLLTKINLVNALVVFISAVQVYFIATIFSLLFVATPIFHLDRSTEKFKTRWKEAKKECQEILKHKLDNYIDYQISVVQVFNITVFSGILFWIDASSNFRQALIFIYTVALPIFFFYLKWSPKKNIE